MEEILGVCTYCSVHSALACMGEWPLQRKAFCLTPMQPWWGGFVQGCCFCRGSSVRHRQSFQSWLAWVSQILNLAGFGCVLQHSGGCRAREVAAGFSGWGFSTSLQSRALNEEGKWSVFGGQAVTRGKQGPGSSPG